MKTITTTVVATLMLAWGSSPSEAFDGFHFGHHRHVGFYGGYGLGGYGFPAYGYSSLNYGFPGYGLGDAGYFAGYPGIGVGVPGYGYGFGGYPASYQTVISATTYYPPIYTPPVYNGGFGYPLQLGSLGYPYRYYTHAPGYSFSYFRGTVPTYYPGQYGYGYGYYGYGPFGW